MLPCALRMMEELKPRDYLELLASRTAWVLWLCMLGRKSDARALLHAEQFDGLESMVDWLAAAAPPRPRWLAARVAAGGAHAKRMRPRHNGEV